MCIRDSVFPDGDIGCAYIDSTTRIKFRRIPSSAIRLSSSDWSSQEKIVYSGLTVASATASELQNGDLCIWYQDSRCFILARQYNTGKIYGFVSDDQGDTWDVIAGGYIRSLGDGLVYDSGAASMQFNHMVATPFEGRTAILAHANNSLHILYFGGYSTIGYPALVENATDSQYSRWETTWNPVAVPSTSSNWGTTGAGTQTINANGLDISTLSNNRYYSYSGSFPADYSEAWMIRFRVQIVSATNKTLDYIAFRANQDDGANSRTLKIRFAAASFDIRDNSSVLTTVTHDMTQDTEFVIVWLAGTAKISYRHVNSSHAKSWTTYTASIPTYATGAGNSLDWGHINTPFTPTSLQSYWREFYVSTGAPTGDNTEIDYNPASYPSFGEYVYIDGGLRITTQSNPARGEDAYLIEPRYDNPIDNVFHQIALSPRLTWRSAADLTNESIAWYIDPVVQTSSKNYHGNSVFGIYLGNINWRTATLQKWDGAGWTSIMPIDTSSGLSSTFERAGHSIQCDTTGSDFYLHRNEAANWRCILESGGTEYPVKLKASTEGVWGKNTDTKRAILMIDTSITDPSTLPTSGNIKLMPDSVCLVLQGEDDSVGGEYAYRLFISSQDTVEGYYQIGSLVYGQVMMVAPQYQRGRVISYEPNIQEQETLDGMYYARKMSNGKRNISVAWTEPVDTTQIYLKDPNYWQLSTISGSHPIANYGDAPLNMLGVAEELSGTDPLIYLPSLGKNQNRITLNRMMDHMYCRISGGVSIESVLGEEEESELWRVATVNLVEIE